MQTIDNIFTNLDTSLYYLQQQLSVVVSLHLNHFTPLIFIFLFIGGLFTSLNPCLISILPLTISYLYTNKKFRLLNKVLFIFGISTSLIIIILVSSFLNQQYYFLITKIPIFSSILTVLIALNLLQILNIPNVLPTFSDNSSFFEINLLQDYSTGLVLGFSSTACSTPIILTITYWLFNSIYSFLGYIYLLVYFLGYLFPLIFAINFAESYKELLIIGKKWNYVIPLSGALILGIGIFSILDKIFI